MMDNEPMLFLYDQLFYKFAHIFHVNPGFFKSNLTLCYTDCNMMLKVTRFKNM